jgi:acyl-CoA reductase-like NAD-dependent aldehyde dehydrogenase
MTIALKYPQALYIESQWVAPRSGDSEPVINPANEQVICTAPVGGRADVEAALASARAAFDRGPWPRMQPRQRAAMLQAFHAALVRRREEICAIIVAETGCPISLTQFAQYGFPMQHLQYYIDVSVRDPVSSLPVDVVPNMFGGKTLGAGVTVREPVGVVVGITAYNFPFLLNLAKVAPALATGNVIVLKPSPYTPFEALLLGEAADEAGFPPGVLNIVTGGKEVGEMLTSDPRVDMISFTGSDVVGAAIMGQAAPTLKRLHLELGGKSAVIVRADANLEAAAAHALFAVTMHCGQGCALPTRALVHNSVRARFVEIMAGMAQSAKLGDPTDPTTVVGPLIRASQRQRVEHYVSAGRESGARLVTGGRRPPAFSRGFYFEPTIFDDVDNRSIIAQEEIFGPVSVVIGFDTDEQAIDIANDSQYGLAGDVYSADVGRAYEIALQLRTGSVAINGGAGTMSSHAPFGGYKRSGFGREYGIEGLNEFTQLKAIAYHGG